LDYSVGARLPVQLAAVQDRNAWKREHARCGRVRGEESMGNRGERRMQSPARLVALLPSASRHARNLHAGARASVRGRRANWRPRGSGRSWRTEFVRVGLYFVAAAWGPSASKAVGGDARRTGHPKLPTDWQPAVRRRSGERIELLQVCLALALLFSTRDCW
jgi:hypothetical protein